MATKVCIVSDIRYQFFCKKCHLAIDRIYLVRDENNPKEKIKYCPNCVPEEVKEGCIMVNQNRERIDK